MSQTLIKLLQDKGVDFVNPQTNTLINIDPDKIRPGAVLYPGVTLEGKRTFVGKGARVGVKGPVAVKNSVVGPGVILGQGAAEEAVFLEGSRTGIGFSCRKGTVYEEAATSAEQTDTKMTILFPWVTYGSNINGCELLAAGGTGPELGKFTEFGSGFIHFNFTVRCDKATPSLFGNVPEGVFLRSARIFIGGNTSVIGPVTAEFGSYAAAGIRITENLQTGKIYLGKKLPGGFMDYDPAVYPNLSRVYRRNINFIANLTALFHWYQQVRVPLFEGLPELAHTYREAQKNVQANIRERIEQLEVVVKRLPESEGRASRFEEKLKNGWPWIKDRLNDYREEGETDRRNRENFLNALPGPNLETGYLKFMKNLSDDIVQAGICWL
ncbi:MAG: hypothetical protein ACE5GM_09565, partial [bacterium]